MIAGEPINLNHSRKSYANHFSYAHTLTSFILI